MEKNSEIIIIDQNNAHAKSEFTAKNFAFHPEKSLFDQAIVRWIAAITISIFLLISLVILCNTMQGFLFDGTGFNELIKIYQVPLGILAVGLTLIGICGANHRSEQTKRQIERTSEQIRLTNFQIEITQEQNKFSNFYKHLEEFEKYCDKNGGKVKFSLQRKLYAQIFPNSRKGSYSVSEVFIERFKGFYLSFKNLSDGLAHKDTVRPSIAGIVQLLHKFEHRNGLARLEFTTEDEEIPANHEIVLVPGGSLKSLFESVFFVIESLDVALRFDLDYQQQEFLRELTYIDINGIPDDPAGDNVQTFNFRQTLYFSGFRPLEKLAAE